jgi:hypothetical protein
MGRRGKGAGRVWQVAWRREGGGNGAARARARGGARRRQQPVPAEAGDGQGDKGGHVVGGHGACPWAGLGRKGSGPGEKEKKWAQPQMNSADFDLNQISKLI